MARAVERYVARNGVRVYMLPLEVFPRFWGHAYVLIGDGVAALIDTGSGLGASDDDLLAGFAALREQWDETLTMADLQRIIITHAHMDHFGGVHTVRQHTQAPIVMHAIDRRVLTNYEGRLAMASRALHLFLMRAGVDAPNRERLMQMYGWNKGRFQAIAVDEVVEDGDIIDDLLQVIHAPGHCPGQICLRMDEVLFSADHILARTSPHLSPESITPGTGLEHYQRALRVIRTLDGIELILGGHEKPMHDLHKRIDELFASHQRKLDKTLDVLRAEPQTIAEVTARMYAGVEGYDELLALEQAGAHMEYLYLRGHIRPINIEQADEYMTALRYEIF